MAVVALAQEDGFRLLQEDESVIVLWETADLWTARVTDRSAERRVTAGLQRPLSPGRPGP